VLRWNLLQPNTAPSRQAARQECSVREEMSELFGSHDTLILYSFMYRPERELQCPGCTHLLDGIDGEARHMGRRAALHIVAKSSIALSWRRDDPRQLLIWFSVVSVILVLFGIVYTFFGLAILPVDRETLLPWEVSIYGALMTGWGTTLLCVGRLAFQRNDVGLMKALLCG
jgi:hypothetical protein